MKFLAPQLDTVEAAVPLGISGRVQAISGLTIEASDLPLPLGCRCRITSMSGRSCLAEVIGFQSDRTLLMPLSATSGVSRGDRIENVAAAPRVRCSTQLLGRVLDGLGRAIDGKGPVPASESRRIDGGSVPPLAREPIRKPLTTGVRAIDALLTCGTGQRMGIFSGPGVGKSTLISTIARHTSADVSVVALIGERGREVQEFLEHSLGEEGLAKCVVIASTGDEQPLLRVRAAQVATTIAEYFRDAGNHVLLVMDSLTRMCHAQRQIGLAAREPPATRGYPPSVFALIPEILERAGQTPTGSITGFYTVLVEGDDFHDPIADAVKGITDGQLWLCRSLANKGHFPAIDVLQSISRVREEVADDAHVRRARKVLSLLATYKEIEDLVNVGAYVAGVNAEFDAAVQCRPKIIEFLRQPARAAEPFAATQRALAELSCVIEQTERRAGGAR
ncbi:MAG TPA: FliI/YscN family ATPase [Tepidisphaeraceae bacterium]|nr:FliI/YscN family ATPase [Tepidisphaeraceae bacterium]